MRRFAVVIFILIYASLSSAQTFNDFLTRVNTAPMNERPAIVDSLMSAVPGFPYTEPTYHVHFLYRGSAGTATVAGDMNNWIPSAESMTLIAGTDLWYRSRLFEEDARLDYKFVLNGSNWILDPRNPFTVQGGFGPNSELRMPLFVQPPEINYYPEIGHGTLRDTSFTSQNLGNTRTIRIYTPPGYDPEGDCYPLLLVHDGLEYVSLARSERILDYLIHHNLINPLVAVFVPPVNRTPEYAGNQQAAFGRFITEELLVWVDSRYNTCTDPNQRGTVGASNGGNIALWLGVTYPEVFGLVGAQSPNVQQSITDTLTDRDDLGLKFYVDIGTYDIPVLIPLANNLRQLLQNQQYPVFFQELHDGHSWGNWRAHLDECLIYLYPSSVPISPEGSGLPESPCLVRTFPNPFNPNTTISFDLDRRQHVHLTVFDIQGRHIDTLASGMLSAGKYAFAFDGASLPSGIYLARFIAGSNSATVKMILLK